MKLYKQEIVFVQVCVILPIVSLLTIANTCWTKTALGRQLATTTVAVTPLSTPVLPQIWPKTNGKGKKKLLTIIFAT